MKYKITRRTFIEKSSLGMGSLILSANALSLGLITEPTGARNFSRILNLRIPMSDGVKLAAKLWLPENAQQNPVPVLFGYYPYRKRDGTRLDDETQYPDVAQNGYARILVDIRGSGDSGGLPLDEYVKQEHGDAVEIIDWLASQPWCTGKVSMDNGFWGGINSLQDDAQYNEDKTINGQFVWGETFVWYRGATV